MSILFKAEVSAKRLSKLRTILFASIVVLAPLAARPPAAFAQESIEVSYESFHDALSEDGDWFYSDRWGEVWQPDDIDEDWRPYTIGHWEDTYEYGGMWVSDEGPWSDIVYHYGRWVYDPEDGWLWIPGYVWAPAWVVWRSDDDDGYTGWMPMPPDEAFLEASRPGYEVSISFGHWDDTDDCFGYRSWYGPGFSRDRFAELWTFIAIGHIGDHDYRRFRADRARAFGIFGRSRNATNYTVVNNVIVNRGGNFGHARGWDPGGRVHAGAVHRNPWFTTLSQGQRAQFQMRNAHPRGNGAPRSAPPPSPQDAARLSRPSWHHPGAGPQSYPLSNGNVNGAQDPAWQKRKQRQGAGAVAPQGASPNPAWGSRPRNWNAGHKNIPPAGGPGTPFWPHTQAGPPVAPTPPAPPQTPANTHFMGQRVDRAAHPPGAPHIQPAIPHPNAPPKGNWKGQRSGQPDKKDWQHDRD